MRIQAISRNRARCSEHAFSASPSIQQIHASAAVPEPAQPPKASRKQPQLVRRGAVVRRTLLSLRRRRLASSGRC